MESMTGPGENWYSEIAFADKAVELTSLTQNVQSFIAVITAGKEISGWMNL